ncbi:hypothetical protein NIES267_50940 [Calothrix parasitica NIES-267]|uniref:Uncharacterized protein n=1 Tax=Calothrix parasitica NIES-267 TaxID=1973488 RepID=A0A1Z4LWK5_9CYAN|nr:hypothetical protein NIES267_50940 [Calothrix parasitica NIES-267]
MHKINNWRYLFNREHPKCVKISFVIASGTTHSPEGCGSSQDFEIASLRMSYRTRSANAMTITILILQNWDAPI